MPHTGVYTSPEERQRVRQSYYATSEKTAGVAHLWHIQQLADIRFSPNHTIQDAPDVDFHSPSCPADAYRELFAQRYAQQVQHDEQRVHEENKNVYRSIVLASDDDARRARHMNLVPTENEVRRFDNIQQQTLHRSQDRERRQRVVAEQNKKLLGHLVSVPPHVRPTKELDTWYHTVHKKRLAQLSRFKPAEQYAGEHLLEGTAAYAAASRRAGSRDGVDSRSRDYGATPPLVRGQPYPAQSMAESATGDVPSARRARRPEWQPLAATDIPRLHHGVDRQMRGRGASVGGESTPGRSPSPAQRELFPGTSGGASTGRAQQPKASRTQQSSLGTADPGGASGKSGSHAASSVRRVAPQEEGGVTQLWRRAVEERHGSVGTGNRGRGGTEKHVRAMAACEEEDEGVPEASTLSPRPPRQPSAEQQQQQQQPNSMSRTDVGGRQARPVKSAPKGASSHHSLPTVRAAPSTSPPGRSSPDKTERQMNSTVAGDNDDDDEDAALKALMQGWSQRSAASGTTYAPV